MTKMTGKLDRILIFKTFLDVYSFGFEGSRSQEDESNSEEYPRSITNKSVGVDQSSSEKFNQASEWLRKHHTNSLIGRFIIQIYIAH